MTVGSSDGKEFAVSNNEIVSVGKITRNRARSNQHQQTLDFEQSKSLG